MTTLAPVPEATATRPKALRRVAVAGSGLLACTLPTLWGAGTVAELVTGAERDHLFHQVTGQGLLLSALWLGALVPLLVAGWRGVRPSTAAGLAHVAVAVGAAVAAGLAPGNGGAVVAAVVVVTGALVWAALPLRPRLSLAGLDPVLAPLALAAAALFAPFVVDQGALQRHSGDEHAQFSHYFDMAWISVLLVALIVLAALAPAARSLALVGLLGAAAVGAARVAFTPETTWSLLAVGLGVVGAAAVAARLARRSG